MIRYLSAIGMSQYTQPRALEKFMREQIRQKQGYLTTYVKKDSGRLQFELSRSMGPFYLMIMGQKAEEEVITGFCAGVHESRCRDFVEIEGSVVREQLYLTGFEDRSGEAFKMLCTRPSGFYRCSEEQEMISRPLICYGLSVEGKVLLGVQRDEHEQRAMEEEEAWRKETVEKALQGDEEAIREIEQYAEETDREIRERMRDEDLYTIFDGFFVAHGMTNLYMVLGDILYVDRLLNPLTGEWVYRLKVKVMGSDIGVYIHPRDLVGEPEAGRRFLGEVFLQGELWPERTKEERGFF